MNGENGLTDKLKDILDDRSFDEIALHEAGHVVALYLSGIGEEFTDAVTGDCGVDVKGLTRRTGASLLDLSRRFSAFATATKREFNEVCAAAPSVCLPQICYFFGGGSMDRAVGRDCPTRNAIDDRHLSTEIMGTLMVSDLKPEAYAELREMVDAFLHLGFEENAGFVRAVYEELRTKKSVTAADIDRLTGGKAPVRPGEAWKMLEDAFAGWCARNRNVPHL